MASPLDAALLKLANNQSIAIQTLGDSTTAGCWDYASLTPAAPYGWVGRFALLLGELYDANVNYIPYLPNTVWTGAHTYGSVSSLRTTSRTGAPTITARNGGVGGAQFSNQYSYMGSYGVLASSNPDILIIGEGLNDIIGGATGATFASGMQSFVATVRAHCPSAPIVVTTQNRSLGSHPTSQFLSSFSAMTTAMVGSGMNLTPPLQLSGTAGVWVMDTQQAYPVSHLSTLLNLSDTVGGLHPNSAGYAAQAQWMLDTFLAATTPIDAPVITTEALNPMTWSVPFSQTLEATSAVPFGWSTTDDLPEGLALNSLTGEISGTPTGDLESFTVTVRAQNIGSGDLYSEATLAGSVGGFPFIPTGIPRVKCRLIGQYYLIPMKIRITE